ncbi:MAG: type II secretion system F family protein [Verrucomicrobiota bacterium]
MQLLTSPELWFVPTLFAICFGGFAYSLLLSFKEGADQYHKTHAEEAAEGFEDIFLFIPPKRIADISRTLAIAVFALFFMVFGDLKSGKGIIVGLCFGGFGAGVAINIPKILLKILRERRLRRFNEQLVEGLMTMSNALRAGFSIMQAFETIVKEGEDPIGQEFRMFLQQTRVGMSFEDALGELEERVGSEDLTLMIRSIETARVTGGNLTEVFEKIASTIRERARIEGRIRSLTSQGRMQAIVVGSIPILLLLAMTMMDPEMMVAFMTSPAGIASLILVIILEVCGILVIRKIVNIEV